MAFSRSFFLLALSAVIQCCASNHVPVYMWGDLTTRSVQANPLYPANFGEFNGVIQQELKEDPYTVVFIEDTLSVEDFSSSKSFDYLESLVQKSAYLPSVENPLRAIEKLASTKTGALQKQLTPNGLIFTESVENPRFEFIFLKDEKEGETRAEKLARHDAFMKKTVEDLKEKYGSVVAVYTGAASWAVANSRNKRQVTSSDNSTQIVDTNLLLYTSNLVYSDGQNNITLSGVTSHESKLNGTDLQVAVVLRGSEIDLYFNLKAGYWYFYKVQLVETTNTGKDSEELLPTEQIYAFNNFSYRCGQSITFASVNASRQYRLTFHDVQLQPFMGNRTTFGDSINCVGFFTVPIWAGLFVVFILLAITFYGIMMMMDIRTMDRFDDPKGKTININAAE